MAAPELLAAQTGLAVVVGLGPQVQTVFLQLVVRAEPGWLIQLQALPSTMLAVVGVAVEPLAVVPVVLAVAELEAMKLLLSRQSLERPTLAVAVAALFMETPAVTVVPVS